jgi:aminocarboxymuconate-semialdehyde decarboxylase
VCSCSFIRRATGPEQLGHRFKGNGYLSNVIGNPLETTIALSHVIFEGTLASFPSLKICAAHAGGFPPSYAGAMPIVIAILGGTATQLLGIKA